ncbi:hypothetical protein K469DRAFT_752864 [Zopfia rhizophila CBS 207.26]|uniref:Uncharacterized protein n=1 Tax=Zopfia rhizophila CBS 207.26 TaxID=1314779 RepID=A0A6A6DQT6_9PEZI|nr:hypothetical protein K469DRAFT_752864 [Zopfia rhizophila CBS 207.26]
MFLFTTTLICSILSLITASPAPLPTPAPELYPLEKRACSEDNCLRAMIRRIETAAPFCATYTTDVAATIPTWATAQCASNPSRHPNNSESEDQILEIKCRDLDDGNPNPNIYAYAYADAWGVKDCLRSGE